MATISFRIRGKKPKTLYQIKLRLSISRGNTFEVNTGIYIDGENWDFTNKLPNENSRDIYIEISSRLETLRSSLNYLIIKQLNKGLSIDSHWLKTKIYEINFIKEWEQENGRKIDNKTLFRIKKTSSMDVIKLKL